SDRKLMTGPDRLGALVIITDGETGYLETDPQKHGIPVIACIVSSDPDTTLRYFPVPDWMTCVKIPPALVCDGTLSRRHHRRQSGDTLQFLDSPEMRVIYAGILSGTNTLVIGDPGAGRTA